MTLTLVEAISIIQWLQSIERPNDRLRAMLEIMEGKLETYLISAGISNQPHTTH